MVSLIVVQQRSLHHDDTQGILTGISYNGFSVTLNERNLGGDIIENGLQAILRGSLDVGQFLRQVYNMSGL